MIVEGIVTTQGTDGGIHASPMGARVDPTGTSLVLRPFTASTTYRNLVRDQAGVFHLTDDALLLVRCLLGTGSGEPSRPADLVPGRILTGTCRYDEFRVTAHEVADQRATLRARVLATGQLRPFRGWNRGRHAVLEASILASRLGILPLETIVEQWLPLRVLVYKTGGPDEHAAFALLTDHLHKFASPTRPELASRLAEGLT